MVAFNVGITKRGPLQPKALAKSNCDAVFRMCAQC
jgi:hypothetical protein